MNNLFFGSSLTARSLVVFTFLAGFFIILNISCKDSSTSKTSSVVFPSSNISYGKQVQPLFNQVCAFPGCHGADTFLERGYSLDSYQDLTPGAAHQIVIPGNPDGSILIQSIEGSYGPDRMPLNLPALNDNQIQGLRKWIAEGARNN